MAYKIDLCRLSADAANEKSELNAAICRLCGEIYAFLESPSESTAGYIRSWQRDFDYIYGSGEKLSANNRVNSAAILQFYGLGGGDIRLLFFAVQTCFTLLIKQIIYGMLRDKIDTDKLDAVSGIFGEDYYCWPRNELNNGFNKVLNKVSDLVSDYFADSFSCRGDNLKRVYEAMIPRTLRHALGEYYTPDWLVQEMLGEALRLKGEEGIRKLSFTDPTCGSGSFLVRIIAEKKAAGSSYREISETVCGYDINPLAVLTAKANFLLSVMDMPDFSMSAVIPVYRQDILKLKDTTCKKTDIVIGNPPWVSWEYLPEDYRASTQNLWCEYGLFSASGRALSFSKEDISALISCISADRLLKNGGLLALVLRQGLFKSERNGAAFRGFQLRDGQGLKVLKVCDLSRLRIFNDAEISAALFFAEKGRTTIYPVRYELWNYPGSKRSHTVPADTEYACLKGKFEIVHQFAIPSVPEEKTSPWLCAEIGELPVMQRILGSNKYRARTGVFTGGANAVYWLSISGSGDALIEAENIVERAKRRVKKVFVTVEKKHVYPMVRGSDIHRWGYTYSTYLLCPHTAETKIRPVSAAELEKDCPLIYGYLSDHKVELDARNGFAGWEKAIQKENFYALLRVGEYTFSKYKVVWRYIAREFICAVVSTAEDPYLGKKTIIPNEKLMYISTDSEDEAYYICGLLSSGPVSMCVRAYMNPTSISAHVLSKLKIAEFDRTDSRHMRISLLCREGHGKENISEYLDEIDRIVRKIYNI